MQGILICGIMAYLLIVAAVESNRERKEYEEQMRNRKQKQIGSIQPKKNELTTIKNRLQRYNYNLQND